MSATASRSVGAPELFPVPLEPRTRRLESIDILRGLLMILMALDHTRDYFSNANTVNPVDPLQSWPALFLTRWVTHLCAPGFVALAGASVYLQRQRGKTTGQLRKLLITRGLWLILMELTVVSFGWSFCWAPFMQVIWAVGISMVGLGLLMGLPTRAIFGVGVVIVTLHNLLDGIKAESFGRFADLWRMVHEQGPLMVHGQVEAMLFYPALPWFGIICVGYGFGVVASAAPKVRQRVAAALSGSFITIFALLRVFHGYGDTFRFAHLGSGWRTAMSFFEVQKYPPSLQYDLATFSVLLLLYAAFDVVATRDWVPRGRKFLETFGRVPFFYYVPHIYLIHVLVVIATAAAGQNWRYWFTQDFQWGGGVLPGWGYGLPVVYAVWVMVIAILYRPCVWFSGVKARRRDWWLSYL